MSIIHGRKSFAGRAGSNTYSSGRAGKNPQAGEFDFADSRHGGKGATWVRIRPPISRDK